jgi:hypothetical protein
MNVTISIWWGYDISIGISVLSIGIWSTGTGLLFAAMDSGSHMWNICNVGYRLVQAPPNKFWIQNSVEKTRYRVRNSVELKKMIDFNWFQFTFNWFQFIFNLFQITLNWFQFDFNWLQFTFNWFQFTLNWFQITLNWFQFTLNWFQFTLNW